MQRRKKLPRCKQLYTSEQCRELDRLAIAQQGVSAFDLMQRAGRAAFEELTQRWPSAASISVCCGKGNNGGDGYIIAGLAKSLGMAVQVLEFGAAAEFADPAALARRWALERGVLPQSGTTEGIDLQGEVIVDAMLGTGQSGALRQPFDRLVRTINSAGRPVLSVDVPTGVNADNGAVVGDAVQATLTVTFIGRKIGLHTGAGVAHAGEVVFYDLGLSAAAGSRIAGVDWLSLAELSDMRALPVRTAAAYKQALGHVVVVGGDRSMGGAALLAGESALRAGAGMVTLITRAEHRPAILSRRPEIMVVDGDDAALCDAVLARATVLVVGPGLGREAWGLGLLRKALALDLPAVIDADGLHGLAILEMTPQGPAIITPHTGEAAVLLGISSRAVQDDRVAAVGRLAQRVQGIAVLKGAGTLVAGVEGDGDGLLGVCAHGNPGMASAGMGDVLAGIIGGLWAQGASAETAALFGVCLHSRAADLAVEQIGQRSLIATDLLPPLMLLLRQM